MKIIIYCQHVLGVGHFFRTLEILKALHDCDLILVTGGGQIDVPLPQNVRHVQLASLMMDKTFKGLHSTESNASLGKIKEDRTDQLMSLVATEQPDLFLIELYPFGRKAFRFELIPVLDFLKKEALFSCKVVCSLRDILVEKEDADLHERRVIKALDQWFDAVLVHSDPSLIKLDSTFSRMDQINIPLIYTGFITPLPDNKKISLIKKEADSLNGLPLIVASAGGGNVGANLLTSVMQACQEPALKGKIQLQLFTGPYMAEDEKKKLFSLAGPGLCVKEFASDFVSLLAAAELSISMAGYNTSMNIVAAKVPSLVWPFDQNQEQKSRVEKLMNFTPMDLLTSDDLKPERLSKIIYQKLDRKIVSPHVSLNLDGAKVTARIIKEFNS